MGDLPQGEARGLYARQMFGTIAPRYDLANHVLSAGLDRRWRERAAAAACGSTDGIIIDVCTGTGDLAMALARRAPGAHIIGCDFSRPMLALAARKFSAAGIAARTALIEADALVLPLADSSADAATCAFGIRNLTDPVRGLAEMVRVVRPGGRVVVLEFHSPRRLGILAGVFALYFRRVLPRLGAWIAGGDRGGYQYLVDSIMDFGPPERTAAALAAAGLSDVRVEPLTGGIASVFVGVRTEVSCLKFEVSS